MPDAQRREELSYDVALARLAKSVCPGCERSVDRKNATIDFCPHCGIGLHDHCGVCATRKVLADELHYSGDRNDSATMNIWLHRQVMTRLAANGTSVPAELRD